MKHFELESSMLTMGGVFYPTGYMVVMLPSEQDARAAEQKLEDAGIMGEKVALLSPTVIQEKIARTVGSADIPLPSAGTEAHIMDILKEFPLSYGQKYRQLVIEDLVD
jgi:hypothetical protein